MKELKEKKKIENQKYKSDLKVRRKEDKDLDEYMLGKQNEWQKKSREKKAKKRKLKEMKRKEQPKEKRRKWAREDFKTKDTPKTAQQNKQKENCSSPQMRKRASRTKSTLPKSPEGWAKTVHLILKSATPRRASLLKNHEASVSMDPLELRKVGRPKRQLGDAKRRLFCTKSLKVMSKKICSQCNRRKERQK